MCLIADNEALNALVARVGKENGYQDAGAEFTAFKDFKIRWSRTYTWIRMEISDYLRGAEEGIIESILRTLFGKIKGEEVGYDDSVVGFLESDEFSERNRASYIARCRGAVPDDGALEESLRRLRKRKLVKPGSDIRLLWGTTDGKYAGSSSVLMKVATINGKLRDADEDVLDFAVYSQIAHIQMGFNPKSEFRGEEYQALLDKYKGRSEAESKLRELGITGR